MISIAHKSKLNNNTNINTQIFQIQYQAQYNTEVSRYFAISRQYQKRSSRYRAFMVQSIALNFFCTCLIVVVELNVGPPSPPAALPGAEPPVTTVSPSRGVAGGRGGRWATSQAPVRLITRAASGGRRSFGPEGSAVKHDRIRIRIWKHQINQFHFN